MGNYYAVIIIIFGLNRNKKKQNQKKPEKTRLFQFLNFLKN